MSPRGIADRAAEVRARAAAHRDRDARLPRAVCALCGGIVDQGQGTVADADPWNGDHLVWRSNDAARAKAGLPPLMGWRRRHDDCQTSADAVRQLIGAEASAAVASAALGEMARRPGGRVIALQFGSGPHAADAHNRDVAPRRWQHVTDELRDALRREVDRARAQVEPRRCTDGACGWCGVSHSIGWRNGPEKWSDGSPTPLCRACSAIWDRRGTPNGQAARRACALEALSGASTMGGDGSVGDLELRTFADLAGDDNSGADEPWAYAAQALEAIKEAARLAWPGTLPANLRDEYRERARQQNAEQLAELNRAETKARREAEVAMLAAQGWTT